MYYFQIHHTYLLHFPPLHWIHRKLLQFNHKLAQCAFPSCNTSNVYRSIFCSQVCNSDAFRHHLFQIKNHRIQHLITVLRTVIIFFYLCIIRLCVIICIIDCLCRFSAAICVSRLAFTSFMVKYCQIKNPAMAALASSATAISR